MAKTYEVKLETKELELKSFEVQRSKLFSEAERNMAGDLKATFIGTFPKLILGFGYLEEAELKEILILLEEPSITVSWWDTKAGDYDSGEFYPADFQYPYFSKSRGLYAPFTVNLIPYSKI
jgi:hypothetical protein